jgi:hypothetical protein
VRALNISVKERTFRRLKLFIPIQGEHYSNKKHKTFSPSCAFNMNSDEGHWKNISSIPAAMKVRLMRQYVRGSVGICGR